MGVMRTAWKDLTNANTYTVPVNTNPGSGGLSRYCIVVTKTRTDLVMYSYASSTQTYLAEVQQELGKKEGTTIELSPSYDGQNLTLSYSGKVTGGIRVILLD